MITARIVARDGGGTYSWCETDPWLVQLPTVLGDIVQGMKFSSVTIYGYDSHTHNHIYIYKYVCVLQENIDDSLVLKLIVAAKSAVNTYR